MFNEKIILTSVQLHDLVIELEQTKEELVVARKEMENYRETESKKTGEDHYTIDDSYYQKISYLVTKISDIETMLANHELADPKGNTVQIGSVVELADSERTIMVVQKRVTSKPSLKEVSVDSPIFGAILMHKTGDICEYTVGDRVCKCVIGKVDNNFINEFESGMVQTSEMGGRQLVK